jgi:hypothetical protein
VAIGGANLATIPVLDGRLGTLESIKVEARFSARGEIRGSLQLARVAD